MSRDMKNTNIEWLGKIPSSWTTIPLKYATISINESNNPIKMTNILSLTNTQGVVPYEEKGSKGNVSKDDLSQYKLAYKGTIVINSMNLKIGSVGLSDYDGCISPVYYVLKNNEKTDIYYINYLFKSEFQKYLGKFGKGILEIREKISMYDVIHSRIPLPPLEEQKKIVKYLNKKCLVIDDQIENNKKVIDLMEEYRKQIFSKILKKYDTDITKMKYLMSKSLKYGANSSGVNFQEDLPRYIRITDIDNTLGLKNENKLSLTEEEAKDYILKEGDILFARSGATVGKTFYFKEEYGKSAFAGYLIKATFDDVELAKYVYNYTNSYFYEEWKNSIFIQSTIQNIGADKYNIMPILMPKDKSQILKINRLIEKENLKINEVIEYRKQIINKLEEYKKSLIYEIVTGKVEV